jgi:hypothetical protein
MEQQEGQETIQMAALDRQLFVEMSATRGNEQPTVRVPVVSQEVDAAPRAAARGGAKMRVNRAVEWGMWGLLMVAPVFALSC